MTLPLTRETLAAAYDYLATTPPFNKWGLPDSSDVRFVVSRTKQMHGWYVRDGDVDEIGISTHGVGRTQSLMETMAHEVVHLHVDSTPGMATKGEHNAAFKALAERVCAIHGYDPKLF